MVDGYYYVSDNILTNIPEGKIHLCLHEKGIAINGNFYFKIMDINAAQIINIIETNDNELIEKSKSVVGRAAVGTLLFGPFWGIIGGMSGVGSKSVRKSKSILIINFWDITSKEPKSILIRSKYNLNRFIMRCKRDLKMHHPDNYS